MSLLLSHGHHHAQRYPLGRVWEEAELVVLRENYLLQTNAILMNQAVSAVIDKKASGQFKKTLKQLGGDDGR